VGGGPTEEEENPDHLIPLEKTGEVMGENQRPKERPTLPKSDNPKRKNEGTKAIKNGKKKNKKKTRERSIKELGPLVSVEGDMLEKGTRTRREEKEDKRKEKINPNQKEELRERNTNSRRGE